MSIVFERSQRLSGPASPLGQISAYWNLGQFFRDPITYMRHSYARYGEISGVINAPMAAPAAALAAGKPAFVFAFGAEANRQIFSNPQAFHSASMMDIDHPSVKRLSTGVTFMNGDTHRTQRRLIMPAFHRRYLETYRDDMVTMTEDLLAEWRAGQTRDIARDMHRLTARIAIKTLFGLDTVHEGDDMGHLIETWMSLATSPLLRVLPLNVRGLPVDRMCRVSDVLEARIRGLIAEKRRAPQRYQDVLSLLMQSEDEDGHRLSDDELVGQVNVLFLAGHETSGNALSWTLFLLSQHPDIYYDLLDELEGTLHGEAPTIEQLNQLPLLERVIKESLRVLPPVVWIQRVAAQQVEVLGHELPSGSTFILSHFMTHHMPELYSEPSRFKPSRWEQINPSPYEFIAFGAGPRMCIGSTFAMMEVKLVLATLLQRFRLSLAPDAVVNRHVTVTLSPKKGIPMQVCGAAAPLKKHSPRGNIRELVQLPHE